MILEIFRKAVEFDNIHGYDDIKDIVRRVLHAEDNHNLLFAGSPASAKTLFLLGILESKKGGYFDGSNATNQILDVLEEKRPKIICIDELEKMPGQHIPVTVCPRAAADGEHQGNIESFNGAHTAAYLHGYTAAVKLGGAAPHYDDSHICDACLWNLRPLLARLQRCDKRRMATTETGTVLCSYRKYLRQTPCV